MLTIEKITTRDGLERLEPIWNSLLTESASNAITLTWEWLTTWWDVFGEGRELHVLVVRDDGGVVGIAPLLKRIVQHYGLLPYRRIEFLASGENEADEISSEYLDFILRRGREAEALRVIFDYLRGQEPDWDEMLLSNVSGESPNLPHLHALCEERGVRQQIVSNQSCVYLPLAESWNEFLGTIRQEIRRKIQRDRRVAIANQAEVRVIDTPEDFEESFEILIRLHEARWASRGQPGVFRSDTFSRFHRLLAPRLLRKGWLKLFVLSMSGEPVSAIYDFTYNGKIYYYQSGFVPGDGKLSSPGVLVRSYAIEKAIEAGMTECDFLKAERGSYKFKWGGKTRSLLQLRLAQPQSKELIYSATTSVVKHLRQIKWALKRAATV